MGRGGWLVHVRGADTRVICYPYVLTSDFGQAIAFSATAAWITTPSGVWTASLTAPLLDVTADVVEAAMDDRPFGAAAASYCETMAGATPPCRRRSKPERRCA